MGGQQSGLQTGQFGGQQQYGGQQQQYGSSQMEQYRPGGDLFSSPFLGVDELARWDPFSSSLAPFGFGGGLGGGFGELANLSRNLAGQTMKLDLIENEREIVVKAEVPGCPRENVSVDVDPASNTLHITAHRSDNRDEQYERQGYKVHRTERSSGRNYRSLRLPRYADINSVRASMDHGVLSVHINKLAGQSETMGRKRIDIGAGPSSTGMSTGTGSGAGMQQQGGASTMGSTGTQQQQRM